MEAAAARRARLAALKAQVSGDDTNGASTAAAATVPTTSKRGREDPEESAVAFRNYKPQGDELKTLEKPTVEVTTVEQEAEKIAPSREELTKAHEVDLLNLAPRKPNWDLKRDVEKKVAKLDKRTKRAINELLREKVIAQSGEQEGGANKDLAGVVAAHENDDDDD